MRFPGFEGEWEANKIGNIATNKSQKFNPSKANEYVKCVELEHISANMGELLGFIDGSQSGSIKNVFNKGDVLFGKLRPYLRKYIYAPFDGVCSSEIWVLKGKSITNAFLYQIVQTDKFIDLANQSSGSKMPRADWNVVQNAKIFFPSQNEQEKISNFLEIINERITTQIKIIKELTLLTKGMFQKIEKNGRKKDWVKTYLKDVLTERKETNKNKYAVHSVSVSKGVINQIEYLGRSFAAKDITNYNVVYSGDVIYTKSPTGDFPFGIIKQSFIESKVAVSPLYGVFIPNSYSLGTILHFYFNNPLNTKNYLGSLIQKGAKNTINITNANFLNNQIYLPSNQDEIDCVANLLLSLNEKINLEVSTLNLYNEQKKHLLQKMFI